MDLIHRDGSSRKSEPPCFSTHTECLKWNHGCSGSIEKQTTDVFIGLDFLAFDGLSVKSELRREVDRPLRIDRIDGISRRLQLLESGVHRLKPLRQVRVHLLPEFRNCLCIVEEFGDRRLFRARSPRAGV